MHKQKDEVIQAFRKGKQEALKIMHAEFYRGVNFFARRLIGRQDVANDIVMEGFLRVWQSAKQFKSYSKIKSYLYTTVYRSCLNHLKQQSNRDNNHKELQYLAGGQEDPCYLPEVFERELVRTEVVEKCWKEIAGFPPQMRAVFELRFQDMDCETIARELNTSANSVRVLLTNGCQRLRQKADIRNKWKLLCMLMQPD